MTVDLLGNVVRVDEVSTESLTIKNGTILITNSDVAIDVSKISYHVTLTKDELILVKGLSKWQYIKCCLRLAWERWKNDRTNAVLVQ